MSLLGVYNYTVILTYVGMLFSFAGIHFVFSETERSFVIALLCLMIAGLMDMFDGKVASTKKDRTPSEKLFGIQIDSMADIISYGVFPSLIVYKLGTLSEFELGTNHPGVKYAVICVCAFYLLCALIRLSYFNVDEMERQNQTDDARHEYRGLPVTSVALILPFVFIVSYFSGSTKPPVIPCAFLLGVMGVAFVSPFKIPKPATFGKILLVVIGLVELGLVICGKGYTIQKTGIDAENQNVTSVFDDSMTSEQLYKMADERLQAEQEAKKNLAAEGNESQTGENK